MVKLSNIIRETLKKSLAALFTVRYGNYLASEVMTKFTAAYDNIAITIPMIA